MWRSPDHEPPPDPRLENAPITPGGGHPTAWDRLLRLMWRHLLFLAAAVGISFAFVYVEATTRLFFSLDAPRQHGDPCLTLIRPTTGPDTREVWSTFGHCPGASRDSDRETIVVDFRHGLLTHYKTESLLLETLPLPFVRALRNQDEPSRAFGPGGSHTYDMGLVGPPDLSWVDLVLGNGGRIHYLPMSRPGWFDSSVAGYFNGTTLQWTGRDWRLRRDDGIELLFPESRNATRLEQTALLRMQAENDSLLVIDRDRAGNVERLSAGGRRLDFEHDTANRVTAISAADTGEHLRFEYDAHGCLARQTGSGGEFEYDQDGRGGCRLRRTRHNGVTYFRADYSPEGRLVLLSDPAGGDYVISYETNRRGNVVRADVRDPDGTLRRITLDETGYWFSRWGSYRGQ